MHKNSLLRTIRTFKPKELVRFEDFLKSPYFNKNENVTNLFCEIKKYAPGFLNEALDKEKIWAKLFHDRAYNYGIMKNLIFDLTRLCEQFMIMTKFEADETAQSGYLLKGLFDRFLIDYFFKKLELTEKKYDINYFRKNHDITGFLNFSTKLYEFHCLIHQHVDSKHDIVKRLNIKTTNMITGFFIEMFKIYNDMQAYRQTSERKDSPVEVLLETISNDKMEEIFENLKRHSSEGHDTLQVYYSMFNCLLRKDSGDAYFEFKKNIINNCNELSDSDKRSLHSCLINSYVLNPPAGTNLHREMVEIFDSMIDKKIIKLPGEKWIEEHVFSYYIIHCANMGYTGKIKAFVEKYHDSINPEVYENMKIEISCLLCFLNKNFTEAMKHLNELEFKNIGKKLLSKSMKVKLLYEMNDYESFVYERDAYSHFLNNNKGQIDLRGVSENRTKKTRKTLDIINGLFQLKNDFAEDKYIEIKNLIKESYDIDSWFAEKISEIELIKGIKPKSDSLKRNR